MGVLVAAGIVLKTSSASISADSTALAKVGMPLGGGTVESVSVRTGRHDRTVPAKLVNGKAVLPRHKVAADHRYDVTVVVRRPGWVSWLTGKSETLHKTVTTPASRVRSQFVTLGQGDSLLVHFTHPVRAVAYGAKGNLTRHTLHGTRREITLPHTGTAGTMYVAGQVQPWERSGAQPVSWFPQGTKASAVASPKPGTQIKPSTPITLTFSKPVSQALGSHMPTVTPASAGSWHRLSSHAIVFRPNGYGYGLDQKVSIGLPSGVRLAGGTQGSASSAAWTVPGGSTMRLQQILATLGYLPLNFKYAGQGPGTTVADQETAAVDPPKGTFGWRWSSTPSALRDQWQPGTAGTMTQGAIMMFEDQNGLTTDGVAGPVVWKALINAMIQGKRNSFGYTFVSVSIASQSLDLWHNGSTVIGGTAVNTGAAGTPTAQGTWPVFEHIPVTTMSGTNPDGSHYDDPDIRYVSYFHGGDALHEFTRAQYGFPQSLGCVEMPPSSAAEVYPYTPIGTLVDVS